MLKLYEERFLLSINDAKGEYVGLPGFRSKLWMVNPESGDFSGYYEWDTIEDAENYGRSFAAGFMTRRSVPGSVSLKVLPI